MEQFLTSLLALFLCVFFPMILSERSQRLRNKENKQTNKRANNEQV